MQQDFFLYDFGEVAADQWKRLINNPVDLVGREAIQALFGLCQIKETALPESASDYELFRALCSISPLLLGHPLPQRLAFLLKTCLNVSLSLSSNHCDAIWTACRESLCETPMTLWDCICKTIPNTSIRCLLTPSSVSAELPQNAEPVLDGVHLCSTTSTSWKTWENEMQVILDSFANRGCRSVFYRLPQQYADVEPNPYAVGQVLSKNAKGESLLFAQGFRFLSEACAHRGWTLLLLAECRAKEAVALLERTERTVGLPAVVWMTVAADTRDALLDFTAKAHQSTVQCGISLADYPSDTELDLALSVYAARYPIGRLAVFSGGDMRHAAYERARFQICLCKKWGVR